MNFIKLDELCDEVATNKFKNLHCQKILINVFIEKYIELWWNMSIVSS